MIEMIGVYGCQPFPWRLQVIARDCPDLRSLAPSVPVHGVLSSNTWLLRRQVKKQQKQPLAIKSSPIGV